CVSVRAGREGEMGYPFRGGESARQRLSLDASVFHPARFPPGKKFPDRYELYVFLKVTDERRNHASSTVTHVGPARRRLRRRSGTNSCARGLGCPRRAVQRRDLQRPPAQDIDVDLER